MIYTVKLINADETIVYNDQAIISENKITGTIHDSRNASSTFDFNVSGSLGSEKIQNRKTRVEIINNKGKVIFRGRILNNPSAMGATGLFDYSFSAFSALDYLNDTVCIETLTNATISAAFGRLITNHNSRVDVDRQIRIGTLNNPTAKLRTQWKPYQTTYETLAELLTIIGGEIRIRYESDGNYLDWTQTHFIENYDDEIRISKNMVELSKSIDNEDFATCLIPLGDEDESGVRLNVKSVNDGKEYYENTALVEKYGRIYKAVIYDTNQIANLVMYGNVDTENLIDEKIQYSAQAVDLSFLEDTGAIEIGKGYHLINPLLNVDCKVELIDLQRRIEQPYLCDMILGVKRSRLSDYNK